MGENRSFNSKILLFGEYGIIGNSMGLAVPYDLFRGQLLFKKVTQFSPKITQSNRELKAFCDYLKYKVQDDDNELNLDVTSFDFDISQGLYFDSTIPQGFGVGSSGALTAGLYDRYARNKIKINGSIPTTEEIVSLKRAFGKMESHFHGSSSGFDPLICYLNRPLLIRSRSEVEATEIPNFENKGAALFLLNTSRPRRTEPLVNLFLEKLKAPEFAKRFENELVVYNDNCINCFLAGETDALMENLRKLSQFQYDDFRPMIPPLFKDLWKQGLDSDDFCLKLCGAGGGGFILGLTKNFEAVKEKLSGYQLRVVYHF